jgi:hypothetical protein
MRPGGLTALAIINFVVALLQIMEGAGELMMPVLLPMAVQQAEKEAEAESRAASRAAAETMASGTPSAESRPRDRNAKKKLEQLKAGIAKANEHRVLIMLAGAIAVFFGVILALSGIGYLKLKKFLGKTLGTVYAVLEIVWGVVVVSYVSGALGEDFTIWGVISFIYPVVTLVCLQVIFKHDFVNR